MDVCEQYSLSGVIRGLARGGRHLSLMQIVLLMQNDFVDVNYVV